VEVRVIEHVAAHEAVLDVAERAGVSADVVFSNRSITALPAADGPGLVAINPPYGVRVGESDALRNLYAQHGNVLRAIPSNWTLAMLIGLALFGFYASRAGQPLFGSILREER
jgi:23S rRNA G2445 N2-methylase RlmL